MRAPNRRAQRKKPDGFIIVAVLWMLGALATLVSIYAAYVVRTASGFVVHDDRLQGEALTSAAIELAAYRLTAPPGQARPTHGAFSFRLGKANIAVAFQTEAARIDLNAAPKELLAGLFTTLGASADRATNYAERIVAWRTPPVNAQKALAADQPPDSNTAKRASRFFHIDELSVVPGLPKELVEQALPFVTVYSGQSGVNFLEAPPEVLASVPGMTKDRLDSILSQRQATADGKALLLASGLNQNFAAAETGATRVAVRVDADDGRHFMSTVIILPFEAGTEPYAILSWQDALESSARNQLGMAAR
jgi:general secretion pathway protein K